MEPPDWFSQPTDLVVVIVVEDIVDVVIVVEFVMDAVRLVVTPTRYPVAALITSNTITRAATSFLMYLYFSYAGYMPTHENGLALLGEGQLSRIPLFIYTCTPSQRLSLPHTHTHTGTQTQTGKNMLAQNHVETN
jgi:hypothetical protein